MILHTLIQRVRRLRYRHSESPEKESGQSLIILAFAFLGLIAMLGLALDLGLVYVERVRIKRAVDAATLAGVVELPYEQQSFDRAIEYLDLNGYDSTDPDTYVFVAGCLRDVQDRFDTSCNLTNQSDSNTAEVCRSETDHPYLYNKPVTNPYTQPNTLPPGATWFLLDTSKYKGELSPDCDASQQVFGTANKLEITGTVPVNMNFMQFFGWERVDVPDNALAENVSSLDVGVVFDVSGSMGYDPVCRGCWHKTNNNLNDIPPDGGSYPYYYDYPQNGDYRRIVSSTITSDLCTTDPPQSLAYSSRRYQVIEAELYSKNTSILDTRLREAGKGYWVLQRDGSSAARFNDDSSEPGTYVSYFPEWTYYPGTQPYGRFYTAVDAESGASPHLEYQFSFKSESNPTWGSQAQIWIRARRGPQGQDQYGNRNRGTLYWALDKGPTRVVWPPQTNTYVENRSGWQMVHLDTITIEYNKVYTLKLYAGSSGYSIDRIFITNNSSVPSTVQTSRPATPGSARGQACDICNPIFGETVTPDMCTGFYPVYTTTNNLDSPLWADEHQPMRTSKEAIKNFVNRLDPAFDQVAFIPFTTNTDSNWTRIASELSCLQASRRQGIDCYDGTNPISYTEVLREIERVEPQNYTCTSCGMRFGLQALGFNTDNDPSFDNSCDGSAGSHCGRGGGANKVLILITDGVPNNTPRYITCDPLTVGGVTYNNHYADSNYDCVLNYAEMAANKGITLYTIGLGFGVDGEFLAQAAELGKGEYYQAGSPSDLDQIFQEILTNIYVRIIR